MKYGEKNRRSNEEGIRGIGSLALDRELAFASPELAKEEAIHDYGEATRNQTQ